MQIKTLFSVLSSINPEIIKLPEEEPDEREEIGGEKIKRDVFFMDSLYAGQLLVKKVAEHPLYTENCDIDVMRNIVRDLMGKEENLGLLRWVVSCIKKKNLERLFVGLL